ncbi:oligosaccharide flippase family protein [Patescibacteria group bacterium]|nr:oligosaccharide flippase family protein [Patescibacteria group bacterium]
MIKAVKKLISSEGLQKSVFLVTASLSATFISAIALIIFSRLLGPEKFGEFSVGVAIIFILLKLTDLGSTQALLRFIPTQKTQDEKSKLFFQLSLWRGKLALGVILIATIVGIFALKLGYSINPQILFGAIFITLILVVYEHLNFFLLSLGLIAQAALMNGAQALTKLLAAIVLTLIHLSTTISSFVLYSLAPLLGVISGIIYLPKWLNNFSLNSTKLSPAVTKFISHSAVGVIAAGVIENISVIQLNGMMNSYETGIFGGVSRISLFVVLGGSYLSQVLFPRVTQYTDHQTQKKYLLKSLLFIGLVGIGFLVYWPLNKFALQLTLGAEYLSGAKALLILMGAALAYAATIPLTALFYAGDKYWYFSFSGIVQILLVILGNLIAVPKWGLLGAAGVLLLTRGVILVLTGVLAFRDVFLYGNYMKGINK